MLRALLGASVCLVLVLLGAAPARASDDTADLVARALAATPGGVQTGPSTIEWDDGAVELAFAAPGARFAVGSCATDRFCVFSGASLTGTRLSFAACSAHSTATLGAPVRSMANALSASYVRAYNSTGAVLSTLAPGVQVNSAPVGVAELACVA